METRKFWCHYIGSDGNTPKRRSIELTKFDLIPAIADKLAMAKQPLWYEVVHDDYKPDDPDRDYYYIFFQLNDTVCLKSRAVCFGVYHLDIMRQTDEEIEDYWRVKYMEKQKEYHPDASEAVIAKDREFAERRICEVKEQRERYIAMFLEKALDYTDFLINHDNWISETDIKAYEEVNDALAIFLLTEKRKTLMQKREEENAERKAKREELKRQEEIKRKEEALKEKARLNDVCEKFKQGKMISGGDVVELCRKHGIDMHLRTLHNLQNVVYEINGTGECQFYRTKGKRRPVLYGCFDVAEKLYKKLNGVDESIVVDNIKYATKKEALKEFESAMAGTDGSEQQRMTFAYLSILDGYTKIDTYNETAV